MEQDQILIEELETKRQELHAARRQIELLTATVKHLEVENAELNSALDEATHKSQDTRSHDQGMNDLKYRQQVTELQQLLEESQASEKLAKEAEKNLTQQLKFAMETALSASTQKVDTDADEISALHLKISVLDDEKASLKLKLYESAAELKQQIDEVSRLQKELIEKDMEIECIHNQFTSQCDIIQGLRAENCEIRSQLEAEAGQVDTGRKGNSLFAEVDDRRVVAEKKILKLESTLRELEEKFTKEQKENKRLKHQILLLRQTSTKGYDDSVVRNLQGELMQSKRTIIEMNEELQKKEAKLRSSTELKFSAPGGATDSEKQFINYLQAIVTQKKKEAEEAKTLADQYRLQSLRTDLHMNEVKNDLTKLKHTCDKLKAMNVHLNMALQELQRKYEPELFETPFKDKVKIALIDQESSSLSCTNLKSTVQQNCIPAGGPHSQTQPPCAENMSDSSGHNELKENSKENIQPRDSGTISVAGQRGKSVRMMQQVDVISSQEGKSVAELKADGQGEKLKKTGGGTGKFKKVTHVDVDVDAQPTQCNQQ